MYNLKKIFKVSFKIILIIFVIHYLSNYIDLNFFEKLNQYYYLVFIVTPIYILKIFINSIKISFLIKIVKNKTSNLRKIFYLLLTAQLSTAFPASFLTSKAWVDTNLIKNFKLNFKDYIKINLFILFYTSLIVISLLTFMSYLNLLLIVFSIIFIFSLIYKKYVNHFMYFYFFLLNLFVNCSISFIVIFYVNPEILYENFIYILISSIISIYLNLFSLLPFNIGYTQMVYSITFNYFSLPSDIAVLIASVKQISQVFVVIFMSIYLLKKRHN